MENSKDNSMIKDLTNGNVLKQMLAFAYPLILANLLQTAYTLVDSVIVGRFVGAAGLSAVSCAGDVITMFTMVGIGFSTGGQVFISQLTGRHDYEKLNNAIGTLFTCMFVLSVLIMAPLIFMPDTILTWLNLPEESFNYGVRYLLVCGAGMVFIFGYNAVAAILRGIGDSTKPLIFVFIASIINCILDLVFIIVFKWDTLGAALATVLGQAVSFIASLIYLYKKRESFGFDFKLRSFAPQKDTFFTTIKVGIPQALQYAAIIASMLYVTSLVNDYGVAASAVNGISIKLESVCRVVANSMSAAATALIAQSVGAGKLDRCKSAVRLVLVISFIYCAICAMVIGFFPRAVFSLFTNDPDVLEWAQAYALVGAVISIGHALRNPYMGLVNGVGNAALAMTAGLLDGVVGRIGLALLFGKVLGYGLMGFWWGSALAGFIPFIIDGAYYYSGQWKKFNLVSK